jgi:hypothetical protein
MKKFRLSIDISYNEKEPLSEMIVGVDDVDMIEPKELNNILATFVSKTLGKPLELLPDTCSLLCTAVKTSFLDLEDNEYVFTRRTLLDNDGNDRWVEFRLYKAIRYYNVYEDVDNPF